MATYNDYFNVDNKVKSPINFNKDPKKLKSQILNSVKNVIEDNKNKQSNSQKSK